MLIVRKQGDEEELRSHLVPNHLLALFARLRSNGLALEVRKLHRPPLIAFPLCRLHLHYCDVRNVL